GSGGDGVDRRGEECRHSGGADARSIRPRTGLPAGRLCERIEVDGDREEFGAAERDRAAERGAPKQPVSASSPIRYPDLRSRSGMNTRAWWLVVLNFVLPGSVQLLAGSRRLGRFAVVTTFILW